MDNDDNDVKTSMLERIAALESRVALLEELVPSISQDEAAAFEVEGLAEAGRGLTLHYTVETSKKNIGSFYDHKWESSCIVSGYVTDAAGRILKWNHITVGFNRGCKGVYPASEDQYNVQDRDKFWTSATLRPKVDHWSGWVECRRDAGVARFSWKTKNCG